MSDLGQICRFCANFDASPAIEENIKQTALSLFEVKFN